MTRLFYSLRNGFALLLLALSAKADLPDSPGRNATVRVCGKCHSPEKATSLLQTHSQWEDTITKMVKLGAQGSDEEYELILTYLSKNFAPETPGPIYLNRANVIDLETALLLPRSQAKAVVEYRLAKGDYKSLADLQNIPGIDMKKIESKKGQIIF